MMEEAPALIPAQLNDFSDVLWAKMFGLLNRHEVERLNDPYLDSCRYSNLERDLLHYENLCQTHPPQTKKGKEYRARLKSVRLSLDHPGRPWFEKKVISM